MPVGINKVVACGRKHRPKTVPLEAAPFGSSKASKAAAPDGRSPPSAYSSSPDSQSADSRATSRRHFQINDIKKETFLSPLKSPIIPNVCQLGHPMTKLGMSAGTAERADFIATVDRA
ncbi:hypothetical protein EYF80_008142 [Liparis tanakae]|uniref:Uncharacterized protein n=1 Tax=Liparis tanakae TaxID=230148 RepID=A0A4Z2IV04_9TELE|nr:hypothetical protein EYF80_008142 [Liparis tanakae]